MNNVCMQTIKGVIIKVVLVVCHRLVKEFILSLSTLVTLMICSCCDCSNWLIITCVSMLLCSQMTQQIKVHGKIKELGISA